jgi:hypothetical protein
MSVTPSEARLFSAAQFAANLADTLDQAIKTAGVQFERKNRIDLNCFIA